MLTLGVSGSAATTATAAPHRRPAPAPTPTGLPSLPPAGSLAQSHPDPALQTVGGHDLGGVGVLWHPSVATPPLPDQVVGASWLVADLDTGAVLAAKDPHGRYLPASTMKTLTAETLIPRMDQEQRVVARPEDLKEGGTSFGLEPNGSYSVGELTSLMLVFSDNNAAQVVADAYGSREKTLGAMNDEAHRLQADDTVALTPNGLDAPGQVSSAYDLALIARSGLADPTFARYVAQRSMTLERSTGPVILGTHSKLLYTYPGAIGVKDGFTVSARACYVGAAVRDGHRLVVAVMHTEKMIPDPTMLLDWGFAAVGTVAPVGLLVDPLPPPGTSVVVKAGSARRQPALAGSLTPNGNGVGWLPLAAALPGGVLLAGGGAAVRRRRRPPARHVAGG